MTHQLITKTGIVRYTKFGEGSRLLFAFHGYEEEGLSFQILEPALRYQFTVICIDLPFHGQTSAKPPILNPIILIDWMRTIANRENKSSFSLMGYSMGGRICLKLAQFSIFPIQELILIAPDGVKEHPLYRFFLEFPFLVKKIIFKLLTHTESVVLISNFLYQKKLLSPFHYRFFHQKIKDPRKQARLFYYWLSLGNFQINWRKPFFVQQKSFLCLGKQDKIIPLTIEDFLKKKITGLKVIKIQSGHQLLNEQLNDHLSVIF